MQKRGTIKIDTYSCTVIVIFTDKDISKVSHGLHKKHQESHVVEGQIIGIAYSPDNDRTKYYIVLDCFNNKVDISTFVHEIDHVKNYILKHRGVKYGRHDDESGAYLSGYIASCIHSLMKKKGISFL